jgi:hypothetical protein
MIRTTLSFCALFGSLILVSKVLQESSRPQNNSPSAAPHVAPADETSKDSGPIEMARPVQSPPGQLRSSQDALPLVPAGKVVTRPVMGPIQYVAYEEDLTEKIGDTEVATDETATKVEATPLPSDARLLKSLEELLLEDVPAADKSEDESADAKSDSKEKTKEEPARDETETKPAEPEIELTPELADLRRRLRDCLAYYYFRPENVATRSPWGSMHWMLAYGVDSQLIVGGKRVNAIGYLNYNGVCNGQRLFYLSNGKIQAQVGVGVQGHAGQYLAMLAQSRVKPDYPMMVDGQKLTVADLIEHEKLTCRPASELTFKLIALSHYLKSDEKWKSNDGQTWDIPRLIKEELAQPINGAACGGSHRLTGFSYAVRKREQRNEPIEGQWKRAKKYIEDFHEYTFKLQNPDASFSTDWFVQRADYGDVGRRVQTTGHIIEWLAFSLDKEQLTEERMVRSVSYLTDALNNNRQEKWSIGPLGHALHALAIYDERVFGGKPGTREEQLVQIRKLQMAR